MFRLTLPEGKGKWDLPRGVPIETTVISPRIIRRFLLVSHNEKYMQEHCQRDKT
jgi:hypothetical protein